ncbi:thioesterase [Micromonospora sediminicola]|uniref:thioesterase n=1 Tax=Micromonospora sediminicola TaxID=946078 RepID=UPI00340759DC
MSLDTTDTTATIVARPSYEGANIRTWVGFKHFMYLVEGAVLQWLRDQGTSSRQLYLDHGLGVELIDCSVQLPAVLELDDEVHATVTPGHGNRLAVVMTVAREGREVTICRARVTIALVKERAASAHRPAPAALKHLEVDDLSQAASSKAATLTLAPGQSVQSAVAAEHPSHLWSWRIPYFYCHFSDRIQHSGVVRALEEVVDRFLHDRGISVATLLNQRSWIPVVSRARVRLIAPAHMEETLHVVFHVTDILRDVMFEGRMTCYVQRGDTLVTVASADILHGYAIAAGPGAGGLAQLDSEVIEALTGARR